MCVDCVCTRDGSAKRLRAEECGSPHSNGEAEIRLRSTNTVFQKGFEVIWQEVRVIKGIVAWQSSALTWRPLMLKRPIGYDTTSVGSRRKRRRSSTNSSMPCTNPFSVSFLPQCERALSALSGAANTTLWFLIRGCAVEVVPRSRFAIYQTLMARK